MAEIMPPTIADIDSYWSQNFGVTWPTLNYASPSRYVPYQPEDLPDSECYADGQPGDARNNAFYCSLDNVVAWDEQWYAGYLAQMGDFAPVVITAHEWGHHLQFLTTQQHVADPAKYTIQAELQADCYAGVYSASAGTSGAFQLLPNDLNEGAAWFASAGSSPDSPWFDPNHHGTSEQRLSAFLTGVSAPSAETCAEFTDFTGGPVFDIGSGLSLAVVESTTVTGRIDSTILDVAPPAGSALRANVQVLNVAGNTAIEAFDAQLAAWGSAAPLNPVYDVEDLGPSFKELLTFSATSAGVAYQQTLVDANGRGEPVHGYFALLLLGDNRALIVDVWTEGPPPLVDPQEWSPVVAYLFQLVGGVRDADSVD